MFIRRFLGILLLLIPISLLTATFGLDLTNITLIISVLVVYGFGYLLSLLSYRIFQKYQKWYSYFYVALGLFLIGNISSSVLRVFNSINMLYILSVTSYLAYLLIIVISAYFLFIYDSKIKINKR